MSYRNFFLQLQAAPTTITGTQEIQKTSDKGDLLSVIAKALKDTNRWEEIQPADAQQNNLRHKRAIQVGEIISDKNPHPRRHSFFRWSVIFWPLSESSHEST